MSDFKREQRYLVIKIKDLKAVPQVFRERLLDELANCNDYMPGREYVCIESDWPEYEPVWGMIKDRIEGNTCEIDQLRTKLARCEKAVSIASGCIEVERAARDDLNHELAAMTTRTEVVEKITIVKSCHRCVFQRRSPHGGGQKECALTNCNRSANYASKVADHCPLKAKRFAWYARDVTE